MRRVLMLLVLASGMALGQNWYLGGYATGLNVVSNQALNLGLAAGVKGLEEVWGVRGGVGVQVAWTYFKANADLAALADIGPEGLYGGAGLEAELKVLPALPVSLDLSLSGILGYEFQVTPYWSLLCELRPRYSLGGGGFSLGLALGFNLYFQPARGP